MKLQGILLVNRFSHSPIAILDGRWKTNVSTAYALVLCNRFMKKTH